MNPYLNGQKLIGDDFSHELIEKWFFDEKEAYANLGAADFANYKYSYHALNNYMAFKKLKNIDKFEKVLCLGGAWGHELLPIINKISEIHIVESSDHFKNNSLLNVKVNFAKSNIDGRLCYEDNEFDLITCFGTLHHIPNVSTVVKELTRVTKKDGFICIREPIISMGDWTKIRGKGITKRERGIPYSIFNDIILSNKLEIINCGFCIFAPLAKIARIFSSDIYNINEIVKIDIFLSKLFSTNYRYHATSFIHKIRPTSVFFVLKKNI